MQAKRTKALTDLRHIVEELRYCAIVLSDTSLVVELGQICIWANDEGNKLSLPEINERIDDVKLKVRDQFCPVFCPAFNLPCISIHMINTFFCYILVETTNQEGLIEYAPNCHF